MKNFLKNSTFVTIINPITNTPILYKGIFISKSNSKKLIQKYKNLNLKIFTSISSKEIFIGSPCYK